MPFEQIYESKTFLYCQEGNDFKSLLKQWLTKKSDTIQFLMTPCQRKFPSCPIWAYWYCHFYCYPAPAGIYHHSRRPRNTLRGCTAVGKRTLAPLGLLWNRPDFRRTFENLREELRFCGNFWKCSSKADGLSK